MNNLVYKSRAWQRWSTDPALRGSPRPERTVIIQALLGHGNKEIVRAGHVNWENPEDPRFVVKWRRYYP